MIKKIVFDDANACKQFRQYVAEQNLLKQKSSVAGLLENEQFMIDRRLPFDYEDCGEILTERRFSYHNVDIDYTNDLFNIEYHHACLLNTDNSDMILVSDFAFLRSYHMPYRIFSSKKIDDYFSSNRSTYSSIKDLYSQIYEIIDTDTTDIDRLSGAIVE